MHAPQLGTNRSFGFVFTFVFLAIGVYKIVANGFQIYPASVALLSVSGALLLVSIFKPALLRIPNLLWFKFGLKLHILFSFAIMAFLFFGLFLPIGWALRAVGKTPIPKKENALNQTYWVTRDQIGDQWTDFKLQF